MKRDDASAVRTGLFSAAIRVVRHLLGGAFGAVLGAVVWGLLMIVVHPLFPSIAGTSGLDAFQAAAWIWLWGIGIGAIVGLIWPGFILREWIMSFDV